MNLKSGHLKSVVFTNLILCILVISLCQCVSKKVGQPPNFLIFLSDDHSYEDSGCYGNETVKTPNIDRFASEGAKFTKFFTVEAMCAPSRSALFTGLYPYKNGCIQNHTDVHPDIKTLPYFLGNLGYEVVLAGKTDIGPKEAFPFRYIGFDEVENYLEEPKTKPFCLVIASKEPHAPYVPIPASNGGTDPAKVQLNPKMVETPETRKVVAAYYDNVMVMDKQFGDVLKWADHQKWKDNLVTIYTSDHGAGLPFAKWTLYDEGLHVPFIVRWPSHIKSGSVNHAFAGFIDILPTLIDLAGGEVPASLDGKSFKAVLSGEQGQFRHELFGLHTNLGISEGSYYPIRSIRTDSMKLICNLNPEGTFTNNIIYQREGKKRSGLEPHFLWASWIEKAKQDSVAAHWATFYQKRPYLELYDLIRDPDETHNLADDPSYHALEISLKSRLKQWMEDQGDSLLYRLK